MIKSIKEKLRNANDIQFCLFAGIAAFCTYFSMYAFRKPFGAATYSEIQQIFGFDFKIFISISQLAGYCLSKFIGVKVISETSYDKRAYMILLFLGMAFASLLGFATVPDQIKPLFMFINGLFLGMIWGLVCGFIEGRQTSDILGAFLCASFILASGYVKQVGKYLMDTWNIPEVWMPFSVGLLFVPLVLLSVFCLTSIPRPTITDQALKQKRNPISKSERWNFFGRFAPGLCCLMAIYVLLTIFRTIRDDFAAEFWQGASMDGASLFSASETPIAFLVTFSMILLYFVRSNSRSFMILNIMMIAGVSLLGLSGYLYLNAKISPLQFMIASGFGVYLAYVPFNYVLFDNLTALLGLQFTCGFLITLADALGYTGSVICYFYKNFFASEINWHDFMVQLAILTSVIALILLLISYNYFSRKIDHKVDNSLLELAEKKTKPKVFSGLNKKTPAEHCGSCII